MDAFPRLRQVGGVWLLLLSLVSSSWRCMNSCTTCRAFLASVLRQNPRPSGCEASSLFLLPKSHLLEGCLVNVRVRLQGSRHRALLN